MSELINKISQEYIQIALQNVNYKFKALINYIIIHSKRNVYTTQNKHNKLMDLYKYFEHNNVQKAKNTYLEYKETIKKQKHH